MTEVFTFLGLVELGFVHHAEVEQKETPNTNITDNVTQRTES